MDRFRMAPSRFSLLAALVLWHQPGGQAADPTLLPPAVAQRKPWLVGLGVALAFLFLIFVFTVVYAIWCSESRDSNKEKEEETVRKEEKEGDANWGLELEQKEEPSSHASKNGELPMKASCSPPPRSPQGCTDTCFAPIREDLVLAHEMTPLG